MVQQESPSEESAPPTEAAPAPERHRARSIIATVLGVLTVLMLVVALCAVWARATVLRRDTVAHLVGDALDEPEVQTALADRISTEVARAADLENRLTEILPDALDRFAPTIAAGAQSAIDRALKNALDTPQVKDGVVTLVEKAHDVAMKVLDGEDLTKRLDVNDGVVTLNLLPLIGRGLTAVQNLGILTNVTLPDLSPGGDPQEQIAALSQALGRDLPADFGQMVVYQSSSLANAQANIESARDIVLIAKKAVALVVILFLVLAIATVLVAPRRWRAALLLGIGTAGAMVVLRSAIRQTVATAPTVTDKPGAKAAIRVILEGATSSLLKAAGLFLLIGLVTAAIAMLRRKQWRPDLVLVAAVAVGVAVPAIAGLHIWSALVGLALGIALPFVARRLLPAPAGDDDTPAGPVEATPVTA